MRRLTFVAVGLVVLATGGIAVAKGLQGTKSIKSVSGTFAATTVELRGKTKTCTTSDGKTLVTTNARYSGTAAGDADLAGTIRLDARSVVNMTDNVGVVEGKLRIDVASGGDTVARFTAVFANGKLVGLATGHAQDPHAKLFANLSSGFTAAAGFTGGKIGAADGGSAVEVAAGKCASKSDSTSSGKKDDDRKDKGKNKDDDDD